MESNNIRDFCNEISTWKNNKNLKIQVKFKVGYFNALSRPFTFIILLSFSSIVAGAETFNIDMLKEVGGVSDLKDVNLDYFAEKGGQLPGVYNVEIYFNNQLVDTRNLNFISLPDFPGKLFGQLTPADLEAYGLKIDSFPEIKALEKNESLPKPLVTYIKDSKEQLDLNKMRYDVTIPQIAMNVRPRNAVDQKLWNDGIPALIFNYDYSGSTKKSDDGTNTQNNFVSLRSGANFGPWRLRNYSTYNTVSNDNNGEAQDSQSSSYQSINTYLQRDFHFLQGGQLTLGEYSTTDDVFDSMQFTGMQLASDDQMLPDSMSQFAPTVRGIARSNAVVTIKQNGYVIYQSSVSPGAFAITDLNPSSNGGDLEVTITESDKTERKFTVATSSVPILQRENRLKSNMVLGKYRTGDNHSKTPQFVQLSSIYGLTATTTVYGGVQYADNYSAILLGLGRDFGSLGGVSLDVTQAKSQFDDGDMGTQKGQSYRIMYAKNFEPTDTDLQLAGYKYSTEGFYSFSDVQDYQTDTSDDLQDYERSHNKRSKIQLTLSQALGDYGSLNASASQQNYWGGDGTEKTYQLGYATTIKGVSLGINYTYTQTPDSNESDKALAFNMSIPLDILMAPSGTWLSYNMNSQKDGPTTQQVGINGSLLQDDNLNYSVQQGTSTEGEKTSGNANLDYKGSSAETTLGYNYDSNSRQWAYGIKGGVVIHQNGITLSQPLSETITLVKATGAGGVKVKNNSGVKTDWRGYALVTSTQPYRKNTIDLDSDSFGDDVDMALSSQTVIPTRGAVVRADFNVHVGIRAMVQMLFHGEKVPFGATVTVQSEENKESVTGIVGDDGTVYLAGLAPKGKLHAQWGDEANQQCSGEYTINLKDSDAVSIPQITMQCN